MILARLLVSVGFLGLAMSASTVSANEFADEMVAPPPSGLKLYEQLEAQFKASAEPINWEDLVGHRTYFRGNCFKPIIDVGDFLFVRFYTRSNGLRLPSTKMVEFKYGNRSEQIPLGEADGIIYGVLPNRPVTSAGTSSGSGSGTGPDTLKIWLQFKKTGSDSLVVNYNSANRFCYLDRVNLR